MRSTSPASGRRAARDKSDDASDSLKRKIAGLALKPVKEPKRRRLPGEPDLVPLFPILYFTPRSACPHRGPLPHGTQLVCMTCSRSGLDHLPALRRSLATDPKPESKPPPPEPKQLTRKERRAMEREWKPREASLTDEERRALRTLGVNL